MDFIDRIKEIAARIPKLKEAGLIKTEEGTKNALIMPFINALGYNVFDPLEVTPELVADVGTKKGEKVDYAILKDGKPIILFECKSFGTDLALAHASQLYRYFSVTSARFGVLTDGVVYRFFTDLEEPNKMDANPFLIFDMTDIRDATIEELKKFTKSAFDEQSIITAASELKYKGAVRAYLAAQLNTPSDAMIKLLVQDSGAYAGRFTQTVLDDFRGIVRDSLRSFVNEQVENRLKSALANEQQASADASPKPDLPPAVEAPPVGQPAIVTTPEERDAYLIIRAILREQVDAKRVTLRDAQSYCAILLDDNNRRPLARLYFGAGKKQVGIFDDHKVEQKFAVQSPDDLFQYASQLKAALTRYQQSDSP